MSETRQLILFLLLIVIVAAQLNIMFDLRDLATHIEKPTTAKGD